MQATILEDGAHASLTVEIPDLSEAARAVSAAGGGGSGPFIVNDDGTVGPRFGSGLRAPC